MADAERPDILDSLLDPEDVPPYYRGYPLAAAIHRAVAAGTEAMRPQLEQRQADAAEAEE